MRSGARRIRRLEEDAVTSIPTPVNQGIQIRDARGEELDEVSALLQAANMEYQSYYAPDRWQNRLKRLADVWIDREVSELIVAVQNGRVAGAVSFFPDGSLSKQGKWPAAAAGILRLGVHPDYRGHGIGRALTLECIRRARKRGIATLALHTQERMKVAVGMYERLGFVRDTSLDMFRAETNEFIAMGYTLSLNKQD